MLSKLVLGIKHELSAAFSPESNGESEAGVKKERLAIAYAKNKLHTIPATVANINYEQRRDGSRCLAELFFQICLRVLGLAMIPTHTLNTDKKDCRNTGRERKVHKTSRQRNKETFAVGQIVSLQNNISKATKVLTQTVTR